MFESLRRAWREREERRFYRERGYWPLEAAQRHMEELGLVGPEAREAVTREWERVHSYIEHGV